MKQEQTFEKKIDNLERKLTAKDEDLQEMESAIKQLQYDLKTAQQEKVRAETCCFHPLSPNSDHHQKYPCNINAYSTPEVMRIKRRFTRYDFVACDKLMTGLRHELFRVNQTYNSLTTVVYVTKNVVGFQNMF